MSYPRTPAASLRVMELRDVPAVARLHEADLAQGFFVQLGERFLRRYHRTFLTSPAAVSLVAEVGGEPAGFLVGSTDTVVHHRHVIELDRWRLARSGAASLLMRPGLTARFVRTRAQRYARGIRRASMEPPARHVRTGILNHIAVRGDMRRLGLGSLLVSAFTDIAKAHGVAELRLQTAADNLAAQSFYADLGWKRQEEIHDSDGRPWVPFVLNLR
ncbi:GNAT family N-acetyltransferase [Nonomuraea sediminis]|uniref:GNAT family N-acetyltransferase n=1 Tax=Nonomuraea sediminis TaxID=2835864 RepID=UPI001BDD481E|nr:GNAT family N-acetyltransferase [Nonomuraea sediminis]